MEELLFYRFVSWWSGWYLTLLLNLLDLARFSEIEEAGNLSITYLRNHHKALD